MSEAPQLEYLDYILRCVQPLVNQGVQPNSVESYVNIDLFDVPGFSARRFGGGMNVRFEMCGVNNVHVDSCFPRTIAGLISEISREDSTLHCLTGGLGNCKLSVSGLVVEGEESYGDDDLLSIEFDLVEGGERDCSYVEIPLFAANPEIFQYKNYLDFENAFPQIEEGPSFSEFRGALQRCAEKANDWRYFSFEQPKVNPAFQLRVVS